MYELDYLIMNYKMQWFKETLLLQYYNIIYRVSTSWKNIENKNKNYLEDQGVFREFFYQVWVNTLIFSILLKAFKIFICINCVIRDIYITYKSIYIYYHYFDKSHGNMPLSYVLLTYRHEWHMLSQKIVIAIMRAFFFQHS